MEIYIRDMKYNGYIEKKNNTYYVVVENDDENKLQLIEHNIKTYDTDFKEITCLYNYCEMETTFKNIRRYKADSVITGHVDQNEMEIKEIIIYFKEFDEFFIKDRLRIKPNGKKIKIESNLKTVKLYENEKFKIFYDRNAGINNNEYGERIVINSSKIRVELVKKIKYNDDFQYYIRSIESIFGFLIGRKMTLLNIDIVDDKDNYCSVITRNMKSYQDTKWEDLHVVDLSSIDILKSIIKKYFENRIISSSINIFYEYIYNDLDETFEFISLVNAIELMATSSKYNSKIKNYAKTNNDLLKNENSIMKGIQRKLKRVNQFSKKEISLISKYYRFDNVTLADKIKYFLYERFNLSKNEHSDKLVSGIVKTRNYFVHGSNPDKLLDKVKLVQIKNLFRNILYIIIIDNCSKKTNINIQVCEESIPIIYNSLINN